MVKFENVDILRQYWPSTRVELGEDPERIGEQKRVRRLLIRGPGAITKIGCPYCLWWHTPVTSFNFDSFNFVQ
jgi:hypothetical protein